MNSLPVVSETIPLWRKIQRENFTNIGSLLDFLEMSNENREKILARSRFILNVPRRLAQKMAKNRLEDPIFRQFVPLVDEEIEKEGFSLDPVEDGRFQKTPKLLHKYHGRALIVSTSACAMHCRYCFRQNFPYETKEKNFEDEIAYIKKNSEIEEIILSGGDPLSLSDDRLANLFSELETIQHVKRIRFHSRFPIGIPERIDDSFLDLLSSSSKQIFFVVHINHPLELDSDVKKALKKIQTLGIPLLNQSVLLKGVNDSKEVLLALSKELLNSGVLPYYLHALDPVKGTSHFAIPVNEAQSLIQHVQISLSGFGVPRLAREEPAKLSKTFLSEY